MRNSCPCFVSSISSCCFLPSLWSFVLSCVLPVFFVLFSIKLVCLSFSFSAFLLVGPFSIFLPSSSFSIFSFSFEIYSSIGAFLFGYFCKSNVSVRTFSCRQLWVDWDDHRCRFPSLFFGRIIYIQWNKVNRSCELFNETLGNALLRRCNSPSVNNRFRFVPFSFLFQGMNGYFPIRKENHLIAMRR